MKPGGRLVLQSTGRVLADPAVVARGWRCQLVGWIGRPVPKGYALGIPGACIHTIGVRAPLDLAFCDGAGRVLRVLTLPPGRIGPRVRGARLVWEMAAGTLAPFVGEGDTLACG